MPRLTPRRAAAFAVLSALAGGCAAVTNPVADGIPVRRVPQELLARPKSQLQQINFTLLRRKEIENYKLDKGDVLAVIAGDLFGPESQQPPVKLADQFGNESAIGYPLPVRDDGTISLPSTKLKPIPVRGRTLAEVEVEIRKLLESGLFQANQARVSVQLYQKRKYKVQVVREDTQPVNFQSGGALLSGAKKGNGFIIPLEYGQNDVLHALNFTGGLPGVDAKNELIIQRGTYDPANPEKGVVRIPLRLFPDQPMTISEEDIVLNEGDILYIQSRDSEVYYTGGVLGSKQVALPRDYDLDVIGAIAQNGGPIANGGFTQNAFIAQAFASGLGTPSPSLCTVLRKLPDGRQLPIRVDLTRALQDPRERILIQPDDVLVMQEKPGEAILRYLTQTIRINNTADTIRSENLNQTITGSIP
jgi:protein involved in polysaccharide export with SLBB domain